MTETACWALQEKNSSDKEQTRSERMGDLQVWFGLSFVRPVIANMEDEAKGIVKRKRKQGASVGHFFQKTGQFEMLSGKKN